MTVTIAIAGKGGTGKTTIAGLLIKLLKEEGRGPSWPSTPIRRAT
jgi:uridine kinase